MHGRTQVEQLMCVLLCVSSRASYPIFLYLLPLVNVADEARQPEKTQQAEDLGEAHDAEGAGGAVHVRRILQGLQVND